VKGGAGALELDSVASDHIGDRVLLAQVFGVDVRAIT